MLVVVHTILRLVFIWATQFLIVPVFNCALRSKTNSFCYWKEYRGLICFLVLLISACILFVMVVEEFVFAGPQYMRNNCWFCVAAT